MVGKMNIKLIFIADVMSFYRILNFLFFDTHERMNMSGSIYCVLKIIYISLGNKI